MTITSAYGTASTSAAEEVYANQWSLSATINSTGGYRQTANAPDSLVGIDASYWWAEYLAWQGRQRVTATRAATDRVVSAWLTLCNAGNVTPVTSWDLVVHHVTGWYGTGDYWCSPSQVGAGTLIARMPGASMATSLSTPALGGTQGLVSLLNGGTSVNVDAVINGGNTLAYSASQGYADTTNVVLAGRAGTTYDPRLTYSTVPVNNAIGPGAASVQLADGSTVHVGWSGDLTGLTLYRRTGGSNVTLSSSASILTQAASVANGSCAGYQVITVTRDASDNVYVIVGTGGTLYAQAFQKTAPDTWLARTMLSQALPLYDAANAWAHNTVSAWHSAGGTAGTIVGVGHYSVGAGDTATQWYALLSCDALLAGTGTLFRGSGDGTALFSYPSVTAFITYQNATGTGLDIAAASATVGFAATYNRRGQVSYCAYTLAANGASFSSVTKDTIADTIYQDANSKLRVLAYSSTVAILAYGSIIKVRQLSGGSFIALGAVDLAAQGMTSYPTAAAMLSTPTWDVIYDTVARKVYAYYLDAADSRRLMRTSVDTSTWLAGQDEEEITDALGDAGSANYHLRVHRGATAGYTTLVTAGNVSSGGAHSHVYVEDTTQVAPSAPILTPRANFDGDDDADFTWTPQDANLGDSQSAYQLQVVTSVGGATYDSGKVSSGTSSHTLPGETLANPGAWQWRVRTYDAADLEGAWSDYSSFQTAAGGNVTVTEPASDNPEGLDTASVTVEWETTGATQAAYRIVVTDTATSSTLSDTGWVTSAATGATVTGLSSDVEYQISVTARNAALVESGAGLRLVTPSFGTPMAPVITATGVDTDGCIVVTVSNPTPEGDRPEVTSNVVQRRVTGVGEYESIGSCGYNESYSDFTAASGVTYDYRVAGTATTGATLSNVDDASVTFLGVWIHDPLDPEGTIHSFPYGKSQRTVGVSVESVATHYAGRAYPVVDYGESQDDTLSLKLSIPNGTNLSADLAAIRGFATARRTLHVKDNRGRAMYATLGDYQEADQDWGSQVTVTARTVDYTPEVA